MYGSFVSLTDLAPWVFSPAVIALGLLAGTVTSVLCCVASCLCPVTSRSKLQRPSYSILLGLPRRTPQCQETCARTTPCLHPQIPTWHADSI